MSIQYLIPYNLTINTQYDILPIMKSLLPIIIVVLTLTGAITYTLARKAVQVQKNVNHIGISANQLTDDSTPSFRIDTGVTPAPSNAIVTPTISPLTPTPTKAAKAELPATSETPTPTGTTTTKTTKKTVASATQTVTTTTVCTPVYGMANTCLEHVVVNTGAEDAIFFNLAGLSYVGGLAAFVKAKSKRK